MDPPQNPRAPRRRRVAALLGLAGVLTYSAASAQADADWLETALEKTLRLSSPWELPLRPEVDATALPDASAILPDRSSEATLVLEVPWRSDSQGEARPDSPAGARLSAPTSDSSSQSSVRLVDEFEDPWLGRETEEALDAAEEEPPSAESPDSYGTSVDLIDPWAN